jgi:predicted Fe-Mo cluster-binding NifX family protein
MNIAVTATGDDLSADIDPRLGWAAQFLMIDTETMAIDVLQNNKKTGGNK